MGDLISIMDAAREMKVHPQTLRRFVKAGRLKAYKLPGRGNRYLVEREDLDKLTEPVLVGAPEPVIVRKRRKSQA